MTRFYFNFRQDDSYSADDEGCKFATVEEAYLGAVAAAQDMWRELLIRREDPRCCAFEVTDETGNELFTLPFAEVLDACGKTNTTVLPAKGSEIAHALESRRIARQAMTEVSTVMREARRSLRETASLLREIGRVIED